MPLAGWNFGPLQISSVQDDFTPHPTPHPQKCLIPSHEESMVPVVCSSQPNQEFVVTGSHSSIKVPTTTVGFAQQFSAAKPPSLTHLFLIKLELSHHYCCQHQPSRDMTALGPSTIAGIVLRMRPRHFHRPLSPQISAYSCDY